MEYKGYKGVNPQKGTIEKWLFTRKKEKSNFIDFGLYKFSGLYSTERQKNDKLFFIFAIICEIGFLIFVSLMLGGFDVLISLGALGTVILDFIGAYFYHKNEDEICKATIKENIEIYKNKIGRSTSDDVQAKTDTLKMIENQFTKKLGLSLIIISALLKIVGSFILFEMLTFSIVLTVIYAFVAYIHIKYTGFYISFVRFSNSLDKDVIEHSIKLDNNALKQKNDDKDYNIISIDNIPQNITLSEINYKIFPDVNIGHSIFYNANQNIWYYKIWKHHFIDDVDFMAFLNSKDEKKESVLSTEAKAFIACDMSERILLPII